MLEFEKNFPENVGIPHLCIMNFMTRLQRHQIPMHSVLMMRHDKLITEAYYSPCQANTLHRMFSITKSLTSIAIGLLADEEKLTLDDPIIQYFPEKLPKQVHPFIAAMTIRNMLMMRTCHASTTYKIDPTKDWVESFFTTPPSHPAGTVFHYDTSSAHTLCALVEKLTGMDMLDYLKYKLSPLDLSSDSYLLKDPFGVSIGGSGLVATSMDILKIGYFLLHKGLIDGNQLLSSAYIETATSHLTSTAVTRPVLSEQQGYGYQIWRNQQNGFTCYGMGGQLIIVLPDYDFICVTTADTQGISDGNQQIYDALFEEVLPYIQETALPVNTGSYTEYTEYLSALSMQPLGGSMNVPVTFAPYNGRFFDVVDHALGYEQISLCIKNSDSNLATGTLSFTIHDQDYQLKFGLGYLETGLFPIYQFHYAASASWLPDYTLHILVHLIDSSVGNVHFQLSFGQDELTVFMRKQEETLLHEFSGHLYCTI